MSDRYAMPRRIPLPESPFEIIEQLVSNLEEHGETTLSSKTIYQDDLDNEVIHLVSHIPVIGASLMKQESTLTVNAETRLLEDIKIIVSDESQELVSHILRLIIQLKGPQTFISQVLHKMQK